MATQTSVFIRTLQNRSTNVIKKQISSMNENSKREGNIREECNVYSCNIIVLGTLYFNEKPINPFLSKLLLLLRGFIMTVEPKTTIYTFMKLSKNIYIKINAIECTFLCTCSPVFFYQYTQAYFKQQLCKFCLLVHGHQISFK